MASRISWSARHRGGIHGGGAGIHGDQVHVWLVGYPKAACGKRVSYTKGDNEWWTGDPKESSCNKCLKIVGYTTQRPTSAPVLSKARPLDRLMRGGNRLDAKIAAQNKRAARREQGLCASCGLVETDNYRCDHCSARHRREN